MRTLFYAPLSVSKMNEYKPSGTVIEPTKLEGEFYITHTLEQMDEVGHLIEYVGGTAFDTSED